MGGVVLGDVNQCDASFLLQCYNRTNVYKIMCNCVDRVCFLDTVFFVFFLFTGPFVMLVSAV